MKKPPPSPTSLAMRKNGLVVGGVVMLSLWLLITLGAVAAGWATTSVDPELGETASRLAAGIGYGLGAQALVGLFGVLGVVLLPLGLAAARRAKAFEKRDRALAVALAEAVAELRALEPAAAYEPDDSDVVLHGARLVEVSRHFDAQTQGALTGTMTHRMRSFGSSFSSAYTSRSGVTSGSSSFSSSAAGLSQVQLALSTTTRDNLMGDALFAVFEAPGAAGPHDVHRVVSMSAPAAAGWVADVVASVAAQLGGRGTHAGATLLGAAGELAGRFAPPDVSYTTDRLVALERRPYDERPLVTVHGSVIARNALLGAGISIAGGTRLQLLPSRFPQLFGRAVGQALGAAEQQLPAGSRVRSLPR